MMNPDELSDRELQDILLVQIAEHEPAQLHDFLGIIFPYLGIMGGLDEVQYWQGRVYRGLEKLHKSRAWILAFEVDNDKRYEFNHSLSDDPPFSVLLETTAKGQQRLQRLGVSSSPSPKDERTKNVVVTVKTIHEQLKKVAFKGSQSKEKVIEKIAQAIAQRRGQQEFRQKLLETYKKCLVTGCDAVDVLEAAHIKPFAEDGTFDLSNGLLLRADIHTLFDLGLIAVDSEKMTVIIAPTLKETEYDAYDGQPLEFPDNTDEIPNRAALTEHLEAARQQWEN